MVFQHVQIACILFICTDIFVGYLADTGVFFFGFIDNLVVDVRVVLHIANIHPLVQEKASQRVKHDQRPCIANMNIVVDRRAAHIDFCHILFYGYKFLFFTGQRIKNLHVRSFLFCFIRKGMHPLFTDMPAGGVAACRVLKAKAADSDPVRGPIPSTKSAWS